MKKWREVLSYVDNNPGLTPATIENRPEDIQTCIDVLHNEHSNVWGAVVNSPSHDITRGQSILDNIKHTIDYMERRIP